MVYSLYTFEDSQPPVIVDCPSNIHVYADRSKTTAAVSWKVPSVTDNSGETITVYQIKGSGNGADFPVGINEIGYNAKDSASNEARACTFFVIVESKYYFFISQVVPVDK